MNQDFKGLFNGDGGVVAGNLRAFSSRREAENDMPGKPELQLITESRNGDMEAMAELFRRHYPRSISLARRILPARDESSDAVQSAYLSAFRNFNSFRGDSSFKTWIARIVVNHCLMHLRKSARWRRFVNLDDCDSGSAPVVVRDMKPTPEDLMQNREMCRMLGETTARLPLPLRETFTLFVISGLSIAETAKELSLTVPATKTRLFRARSFMRSALKNNMPAKAKGTAGLRMAACGPAVLRQAS
jgi:RNA polymerase sigma-70 factor, ECF subfamily